MLTFSIALIFTRTLTSWTIFFFNSNEGYRWGKALFLTLFELAIILIFNANYLTVEPILMLSYRLLFHRNDNRAQRIYYSLFPIVITNLLANLNLLFLLPFFSHQSHEAIQGNQLYAIISYLFVLPFLTIIEYIFSIERFSFEHYYLKKIANFLVVTDILLLVFYFSIFSIPPQFNSVGNHLWLQKVIILIAFFIFLFLSSYLNDYTRIKVQNQIKESKYQHLMMLESYNRYIEKLYSSIRSFRHDYDNILLSLAVSIENKDLQGINAVYQDTIAKMTRTNNRVTSFERKEFSIINNTDLEIFFALKFHELRTKGIDCKFRCNTSFKNNPIKEFDLFVILSTLTLLMDCLNCCFQKSN